MKIIEYLGFLRERAIFFLNFMVPPPPKKKQPLPIPTPYKKVTKKPPQTK